MSFLGIDFTQIERIAVAVSGGGDSLALACLLADWCRDRGMGLDALTVDHGLRPESAAEARYVGKILKPLGVRHRILHWQGEKPATGIQEAAREARYQLMAEYCRSKKIPYLCLAHHAGDQIETMLFRMAKGTGLDGLAGMRPVQKLGAGSEGQDSGLTLLRPLLSRSHESLLETLRARQIEWIEDPSNRNSRYARVRIRNVIDVLENEGLGPERISQLSTRITNNIELIDYLIEDKYKNITIFSDAKRIEINYSEFYVLPNEAKTRILRKIISHLGPTKKFPARLEDVERLASRMTENFKGATLGGCMFRKKKTSLLVQPEGDIEGGK